MSYQTYEVRVYTLTGIIHWRQNGYIHREDGPAIIYPSGDQYWYKRGYIHREDGPAVEYANGRKEWWLNGEQFNEEEFNARTKTCANKVVEIDGVKYRLTPA